MEAAAAMESSAGYGVVVARTPREPAPCSYDAGPQPRLPLPPSSVHAHRSAHVHAPSQPPPGLPRRNGPSCICSLAFVGCAGCLAFCALLVVEIPWITLEGGAQLLQQRRVHAQQQRQQQLLRQQDAGLGRVPPLVVGLGLWDEYGVITPLQLTVALSLATGVDEQHVSVSMEGNHFFDVRIKSEGAWLLDAINGAESSFVGTLNAQASSFGAKMVVSRAAATEQQQQKQPQPSAANATRSRRSGA